MSVIDGDAIPAKPAEVLCDICLPPKPKAMKTCLVCLSSYCPSHLQPHQQVASLKKHVLIDPVANLEDKVCKKHNNMLEFFCRDDQACVCFMCINEAHVTHEAVPLKDEISERKVRLETKICEAKMMRKAASCSVRNLKCSVEESKKQMEKEIGDITEAFASLVECLQRKQAELIQSIQEKQKEAEKQAEDLINELEKEITAIKRRTYQMENLQHTDDDFDLLQWEPTFSQTHSTPLLSKAEGYQPYVCAVKAKRAVAQMENSISYELEKLTEEVKRGDGREAAEPTLINMQLWNPPLDKLMMIQQYAEVDVTLDTYTAHLNLIVSRDGKEVCASESPQWVFPYSTRFVKVPLVLGKEGFSSGRFYFEVRINGATSWTVGIVKEPFNRDIFTLSPSPDSGGWGMSYSRILDKYAFGNGHVLYLRHKPQKIGVFVDCEKRVISFYDVDARALIYSFTDCTFKESMSALKSFLHSVTGTSSSEKVKLHPVFGIFECEGSLTITPVSQESIEHRHS